MRNKKVKPVISFLLAFLMLFSMIPAYAADEIGASSVKIETNLTDGKTQAGGRLTFDVWAWDGEGKKIDSSVTLNGQAVSPAWNDDTKTSYTTVFTQSGENILAITAGGAVKTYTVNYVPAKEGDVIGKAVVSVEAFTIGGGYLIEPEAVDVVEGENTAQLLDRLLKEHGYTYKNTGEMSGNFYLSSIEGGILPIEVDIPDILESSLVKNGYSISYDNVNERGLGEFDYTRGSGWMYCVNNIFPNVGLSDFYLSDGDVVRLQFTLAYGADIGGAPAVGSDSAGNYYAVADKDEMTGLIAEKGIKNVPENVLAASVKVDAAQPEVDEAVGILKANEANGTNESSDNLGNNEETASQRNEKPGYFTVGLKGGTSLELNGGWLLVPEGEDTIVISAGPGVTVKDTYAEDRLYKRDEGGETYTLDINDIKLQGEELSYFLKYLNINLIAARRKPDKFGDMEKYETGAYSSLDISDGDTSYTVNIAWQADLPELKELSAWGADFYTPFKLSSPEQYLVMNKNVGEAEIMFVPGKGTKKIYLSDADNKTIADAVTKKGNKYVFKVLKTDFNGEVALRRNLVLETQEGNKQTISFVVAKRIEEIDSPDSLTDYLCIGSQYSSGGNRLTGTYGLYPEKSLIGLGYWWSPISIGNFGGYVTYYYEKPIEDNPKNPYGIDFIVYGNSNGGPGFSEPGNVLVSENGNEWYYLAGSEHYENRTQWGYEITYSRNGQRTKIGNDEISYLFPLKSNYPLYNWTDEDKITVKGVAIGDGMEAYYPAFGYADVRINSSGSWGTGENGGINGRAKNPYLKITQRTGLVGPDDMQELYEGAGDCFDLTWAVDENGLPVKLSQVHYVKVQTATPPNPPYGGIGEKSTEVNVIARAVPSEENAGVSTAPGKIIAGGNEIEVKDGVYVYSVDLKGAFDVRVEAPSGSNVYINNYRGNSRGFPVSPNKGVIRIIVQDGKKTPLIYYIKINHSVLSKDEVEKSLKITSDNEKPVSRGTIIAALYDLSERPAAGDDKNTEKYADDVRWALNKGLIKGYKGDLALDRIITREELSVILYSYSDYFGTGFSKDNDIERYGDFDDIYSWASRSMKWAVGSGYIIPTDEGKLDPKGAVSGDEATEILYRIFSGE